MHTAFLLLGSNMGDRMALLNEATRLINIEAGKITTQSAIYESPPWGFEAPQPFLNQAVEIKTTEEPLPLLRKLLAIETRLGRERSEDKTGYASRTIDIDLLFYDDLVTTLPELELPHPRLHLRRFVLVPLNDIAPQHIHPLLGKTITELLAQCTDSAAIHKL